MSIMAIARLLWRFTNAIAPMFFAIIVRVPWMILSSAWAGARTVRRGLTFPGRVFAAARDDAVCTRCGRETPLLGRYRCPICKAVEATHAWAPCTICGAETPAGYIACATPGCGEAIPNPMLRGIR